MKLPYCRRVQPAATKLSVLLTTIIIVLTTSTAIHGQSLAEVGHYGSNIGAVDMDGSKVVFNEGTKLRVKEYSLFGTPTPQGIVDLGAVPMEIEVVGNFAYSVGSMGRFDIVDISNGSSPAIISSLDWEDFKKSLWVRKGGDFAYVIGCHSITIIDIRTKTAPVVVGTIPAQCDYDSITGDGGYLYVARNANSDSNGLLHIYSLVDPANPAIIGTGPDVFPSGINQPNGLKVFGDTAYQVGNDEVFIIDISDRTAPRLKTTLESRGGHNAVDISNGILHLANFDRTTFYDLVHPAAPNTRNLVSGPKGDQSTDIVAEGNMSLSARSDALWITDITAGTVPYVRSLTPNVGRVTGLATQGNYLYAGTGQGLCVLDISNPTAPSFVSNTNSRWVVKLATSGQYLLNLSSWGFLEVFNASNPFSLTRVPNASYPVPSVGYHSYRLAVDGTLVAATVGNQIFLFDINGNGTLTQRSSIALPVNTNAGALAANHLYVASIDGNLRTYNVTNPANPALATTRNVFNTPQNEAISTVCMVAGNRLHTMFGRKGYALFDISAPGTPVLLDTLNMSDQDTTAMDVAGNTVYLAAMAWNGRKGIRAINISNPQNVVEVATQRATDFTVEIKAMDGYIFVGEQEGGLRIRNAASGSAEVADWTLY